MKLDNDLPIDLDSPEELDRPVTPLPGRRSPLPPNIEAELRAACASINASPSTKSASRKAEQGAKPQLDYATIKKSASQAHKPEATTKQNRRTTLNGPVVVPGLVSDDLMKRGSRVFLDHPLDLPSPTEPLEAGRSSRYSYQPGADVASLFASQDSTHPFVAAQALSRRTTGTFSANNLGTPGERPASQYMAVHVDTPVEYFSHHARPKQMRRATSQETTASNSHLDGAEYPWTISTAPTSVPISPLRAPTSPLRAPKRISGLGTQLENDEALSASSAAEWMRKELDKRRQQQDVAAESVIALPPAILAKETSNRPPFSRAPSSQHVASRQPISPPVDSAKKNKRKSLTQSFRDYIKPGFANLSRNVSRSVSRAVSREPSRPASRSGSVAASRRLSNISNKDVATSDEQVDRPNSRNGKRSARNVNLNRDLPPLPSLNSWKGSSAETQQHIAALWTPSSKNDKTSNLTLLPTKSAFALSEKEEVIKARLGSPIQSAAVGIPKRKAVASQDSMATTSDVDFANHLVPTNTLVLTNTMDSKHTRATISRTTTSDARSAVRPRAPPLDVQPEYGALPAVKRHDSVDAAVTTKSRPGMFEIHAMTSPAPPAVPPKEAKKSFWPWKKQKKSGSWMSSFGRNDVAVSPVVR